MTINGEDISMIRGDTESLTVSITEDGEAKDFVDGDTVYFTVKANKETTTKTLQKTVTSFTDGAAVIEIAHADTSSLTVGIYDYDIQATFADGTVKTVIGPAYFELLPEVTYE